MVYSIHRKTSAESLSKGCQNLEPFSANHEWTLVGQNSVECLVETRFQRLATCSNITVATYHLSLILCIYLQGKSHRDPHIKHVCIFGQRSDNSCNAIRVPTSSSCPRLSGKGQRMCFRQKLPGMCLDFCVVGELLLPINLAFNRVTQFLFLHCISVFPQPCCKGTTSSCIYWLYILQWPFTFKKQHQTW